MQKRLPSAFCRKIREKRQLHASQWSTLQSGPLAPLILPEKGENTPISHELVVHFPEWTTGSSDLAGKQGKAPVSYELVAHYLALFSQKKEVSPK